MMNSKKISATPPTQKEEIMENPLSPVLNRKRYTRKHTTRKPYKRPTESPGTSALAKPQTSHIPVPVKEQKSQKENKRENIHQASHAIRSLHNDLHNSSNSSLTNFKQEVMKCGKVSAFSKYDSTPNSLSEGKLDKGETKHKQSKLESKVTHFIKQIRSKTQRSPQVFSHNSEVRCASGDISKEWNNNDRRKNIHHDSHEDSNINKPSKEKSSNNTMEFRNTHTLYENSKFSEYSKTTVSGSKDSVPIKVFCNSNFHSTDSSMDSPSPRSPKCSRRHTPSPQCIKEEDTDKELISQPNYNETSANSGYDQHPVGCKPQMEENSNIENSELSSSLATTSKPEKKTSKNIVNVNITPSVIEEIDGWQNMVDKMTSCEKNSSRIDEPFQGFSSEDIENAEMVYQQYKNTFKAMLRKKKKSIEMMISQKGKSVNGNRNAANANEIPPEDVVVGGENPTQETGQNSETPAITDKIDESVIPSSGNRVQICIGNNRIKINIKADNNVEIDKIDSETISKSNDKSMEVVPSTSDETKCKGIENLRNEIDKNGLTVETQAELEKCAVETQANFRTGKHGIKTSHEVEMKRDVHSPIRKSSASRENETIEKEHCSLKSNFHNSNDSEEFGGFSTASGKSISISKDQMSAANMFYNDVILDHQKIRTCHGSTESITSKKNEEDYSTSGFKSGSANPSLKNDVLKADEFLILHLTSPHNKHLFNVSRIPSETFEGNCEYEDLNNSKVFKRPMSPNRKVESISKNLFSNDSNCHNCEFQTASGNSMKINPNYLDRVTKLYDNINDKSDYSESESKTSISFETNVNYLILEETNHYVTQRMEVPELQLQDDHFENKFDHRKILKPRTLTRKMDKMRRNDNAKATRKSLQFDEEIKDYIEDHAEDVGNNLNSNVDYNGFSSASGKKIKIDAEKLRNVTAKFHDLENNSYPNDNVEEEASNISKANFDFNSGFSSASGRKIKVDKEKLRNVTAKFHDLENNSYPYDNVEEEASNIPKANFDFNSGFSSASGRKIKVDKEKLKNANAKFHDTTVPESLETPNAKKFNYSFPSTSGIPRHVPPKYHKFEKSDSYTNLTQRPTTSRMKEHSFPAGFSTASGRKIAADVEKLRNATAKFQDLDNFVEINNGQGMAFDFGKGFTSASGKALKLDEDKLRNASAKFLNLDSYERTGEMNNAGFASASGKRINVNTEKLKHATAKFQDLEVPENILQDITIAAENQEPNHSPRVSKYTDRSAPELIKDVVSLYDETIMKYMTPNHKNLLSKDIDKTKIHEREKDVTPVRPTTSKKRLGMSRITGVNPISKEKLEKARLLFEECDKNLTITPMKSFTNVKYNVNNTVTTPRRDDNIRENMTSTPMVERKSDLKKLDFTPIKSAPVYDSAAITTMVCQDEYDGTLLFRDKSVSNFKELQNDIDIEYMQLKRKLETLEARKTALEEQKFIIEQSDYTHTRPILGNLSIKKQNSQHRIPLSQLTTSENSLNSFNIDSRIFEINARNADKVHFNATKNEQPIVITLDGAKVVPNTRNTIGVTEINNAFQAMKGVEPKLVPKGWVLNHYKWIVWKLASYERQFPQHFKKYLTVDNIMQQLKYRYDVEIDKACRPSLRKIMEMDDVPNKRMVLCVADIIQIFNSKFELLLTDGWYAIRTVIDALLCQQIYTNKLTIGTKLFIQGAELLNCEGCHPLEAPEHVKLKIGYNNTRRAMWHIRLGYYKIPIPFPISLRTIHPDGGPIARIKVYIVRVYPLRYMEEYNGIKIWRNAKAEEKRALSFENERMKELEKIKHRVYEDFEKSLKPNPNQKVDRQQLGNITCPKLLYQIMEGSKDPESLYSLLNPKQKALLMDYKMNVASERQRVIAGKMNKHIEALKLSKRIVTPMLKLLVTDATEDSSKCMILNVWKPSEEQLEMFQEESCISVYNIMIRKTREFNTIKRTMFEVHEGMSYKRTQRQLLPISMTADAYYKPLFNEFDTIGIIVDFQINNFDQELWLSDFIGRLLYVKIVDGPKICSLIDSAKIGQTVALCNLVLHLPHSEFGQAVANQLTTISQFPKLKSMQTAMELFNSQINDLNKLIHCCKSKIETFRSQVNLKSNESYQDMSLLYKSNANMCMDEPSDENASIPSRLTEMDVAMSLLDTDQFL